MRKVGVAIGRRMGCSRDDVDGHLPDSTCHLPDIRHGGYLPDSTWRLPGSAWRLPDSTWCLPDMLSTKFDMLSVYLTAVYQTHAMTRRVLRTLPRSRADCYYAHASRDRRRLRTHAHLGIDYTIEIEKI